MKKINYLLPLLVVPFLFSCANNGGGGDDPDPDPEVVTEVTEAEFKDAIINKGETHCQTTFKQIKYTNEQTMTTTAQCSPGKSYQEMTMSGQGTMKIYGYALNDGIHCKMTSNMGSGWSEETEEELSDVTENNTYVTNESYSVNRMIIYTSSVEEIKFSDFKYENEVYSHEYKVDEGEYFEYTQATIRFADKKVAEYSLKIEREDKTTNERVPFEEGGFTCTYNKIDVVDPRI